MLRRPSSRSYQSPRRAESARETRRAVLQAARQQFAHRGYVATSLATIAQTAGVSLATVKLVGGTKAQLLVAAIQTLMRPDGASVPLEDQAFWREMLSIPDPRMRLREFAAIARSALGTQASLFEVIWQAAPSEPELASLEERASLARWNNMRQFAQLLAEEGALRSELDPDSAADILWALAAPQMYRLLVARRGWTAERWEAWLAESLSLQLLPVQHT